MIPDDWTPVHRDDGERVGYLAGDGRALTLLGTPLEVGSGEDERSALTARGLAALDRRWFARLPDDVAADAAADAARPAGEWRWRPVVVTEVDPARCRIRLAMAPPAELRVLFELPVPVGGLLRTDPAEA